MYFLRASPCFSSRILEDYDTELRLSLEGLLNTRLSATGWVQASLTVRYGGLGVRAAGDLALPAFLSSEKATIDLVRELLPAGYSAVQSQHFTTAADLWKETAGLTDLPLSSTQAAWDEPLIRVRFRGLLESTTAEVDRARLLAVSAENASHWLIAIPIPSLGLKLDSNQLRVSIGLRLGSPLCHPHTCKCGTRVESSGVHGLSCKKSAGRFSRHGQVNDLIKRSLSTAQVPTLLEPNGVSRDDGKRPDGISLFSWKRGRLLCWDFTCSDTLAPSHLGTSSREAGKVAENAENVKMTKYSCLSHEYEVTPICVETLGPWGPSGHDFVQVHKISREGGPPRWAAFT